MRSKLSPPRLFPIFCLLALAAPSEAAAPVPMPSPTPAAPPWAEAPPDAGDDAYAYIVGLIDRGMTELAVTEAQKFLASYPNHERAPMARYRLATTLFDLERRDDALAHFRRLGALDGFEYATESLFRLGQCQIELGELDGARESLATVAKSGEAYLVAPAKFLLGEVEFQAEHFENADRLWDAYVRSFPGAESVGAARRGMAWCAWRLGDAAGTIARCQVALKGGNEAADELRVLMGEAQLDTGDSAGALKTFRSVEAGDFSAGALRGEGFALAALGEHLKAAATFEHVVSRFPSSPFAREASLHRGVELLRGGEPTEAIAALKVAARGKDPETLFWLAEAEAEAGHSQDALATLARALAGAPDGALKTRLLVARGDVLTALGKTDEARSAYESAGSDWALHAAAVGTLNDAVASGSNTAEAERLARQLLDAYPASPYAAKTRLVLAEALFARGEHAAAAKAFEGAAEASRKDGGDPADVARAHSRIAWCHYLGGDLGAASLAFQEVLAKHPGAREAEEAAFMTARAAREDGRVAKAEAATDQYLKRYPDGPWADDLLYARGTAREGQESLPPLEQLVRDFPASELVPAAEFELGERLSALGELARARDHYTALVTDHPSDALVPRGLYGLAWCAYDLGDLTAAAAHLEGALAHKDLDAPFRSGVLELLAWTRIGLGQPDAAAAAWGELARSGASEARVFDAGLAVGEAWRTANKPTEALEFLTGQASRLSDPDMVARTHIEAVFAALDTGGSRATQTAEGQLGRAQRIAAQLENSELSGAVAEAAFFLGEAYFSAGDLGAAKKHYTAATILPCPVRAQALYKLGFVELGAGDLAEAEAAFGTLTSDHATSDLFGEALFLLGEARFRQDDFAGAVAPLEKLLAEQPKHAIAPKARFRLGLAQGELGHFDKCEAVLAQLAKGSPDFPNLAEAELWRGRALAANRKPRAARQAFDRTLSLDQETGAGVLSALARIGIGKLAQADGRTDEALSEFLKVAVLFADNNAVAEALVLAGGCLEEQGDLANARARYEEVVTKHKDSRSYPTAKTALERLTQK